MAKQFSKRRRLAIRPAQQSTRGQSSFNGLADAAACSTAFLADWINVIGSVDNVTAELTPITTHDNSGSTGGTRGTTAIEPRTQAWILNASLEDVSPETLNALTPMLIGQDPATGVYPDLSTVPGAGVCVPELLSSEAPYFEAFWYDTNQYYFGWGNVETWTLSGAHEGKQSLSFTMWLVNVTKTDVGATTTVAPSAIAALGWPSTPTPAGNQIMSWGNLTNLNIGALAFSAADIWSYSLSYSQTLAWHHNAGDTGLYPNNILVGNDVSATLDATFDADEADVDAIVGTVNSNFAVTAGGVTYTAENCHVQAGTPSSNDDQATVDYSATSFYDEGSSSGFALVASGVTVP